MAGAHHLLHLFSTFAAGGPQVRTATLIHALPDRFRHTIVGLDGNFACAARLAGHPRVAYADPPRKGRLGAYSWRLGKLIARLRPDLVLTYNWGAIEAIPGARLFGYRRLLHGEDGFGPDEANGELARRVRFRRLVLPLASRVVVPSQLLLRRAASSWHVPESRRLWIRNGIDLAHFAPPPDDASRAAARAALQLPVDVAVVGTVARLRGEKGLDLLLRAFAEQPAGASAKWRTAHLLIAGDGPEEEALRSLARELGIAARVRFAGNLPDPRDAYRALDLFALSSHTEQMPISLLEAMGCGLPAVSTAVGDVAAMIAPENREFVIASREPASFAAALRRLLDEPERGAAVGAANRSKAQAEYDLATMVERYRALYDELLAI